MANVLHILKNYQLNPSIITLISHGKGGGGKGTEPWLVIDSAG
jgi:hypothetical protein